MKMDPQIGRPHKASPEERHNLKKSMYCKTSSTRWLESWVIVFFLRCFIYEWCSLSVQATYVTSVSLPTEAVLLPQISPRPPPVLAVTPSLSLPSTRVVMRVSVYAVYYKKWTRANVTPKTSSNQQVDSSGLPRIWWNRKQYFIWAYPILANHREVGGTKRLWQWSSPNTETDRKKNHATTQILPMEEGQDGKACSANEKNACKLTSQLHWRQRHKKL